MHSGKHYLLFANCLLLKDSFSASEFEHERGAFAFRLAGRRKPLEHLEMERRLDGVWHKQSVFSLQVSKKASSSSSSEEENVFCKGCSAADTSKCFLIQF